MHNINNKPLPRCPQSVLGLVYNMLYTSQKVTSNSDNSLTELPSMIVVRVGSTPKSQGNDL